MARIRIVCKWPEVPAVPTKMVDGHTITPVGRGIRMYPSIYDTTVFVVRDDGTEEPLEGVTFVSWSAGNDKVAMATIRVITEADLAAETNDLPESTPP